MNIYKKPRKYLLYFLAYFLLVALLPFDHCHATISTTETNLDHSRCNATNHKVVCSYLSFGVYERECHAHNHHIRFLIDSEDAVLKSSQAREFIPKFLPYVIMAIIEPPSISDSTVMQVVPGSSAPPPKCHLSKFSGLSPPCI